MSERKTHSAHRRALTFLTSGVWWRRDELRLHPRVPPPHRDVAPHQAHVVQRPLQNGLRRSPHGQLSAVPPAAQPGPVPDQSVSRRAGSAAPPSCRFWYPVYNCLGFYGFKSSIFLLIPASTCLEPFSDAPDDQLNRLMTKLLISRTGSF